MTKPHVRKKGIITKKYYDQSLPNEPPEKWLRFGENRKMLISH